MKQLFLCVMMTMFATAALAKDTPCQAAKKKFDAAALSHDCPDETTEGSLMKCEENAKELKRFGEMTTECNKKPKKK